MSGNLVSDHDESPQAPTVTPLSAKRIRRLTTGNLPYVPSDALSRVQRGAA